jgi:hypothetical protein
MAGTELPPPSWAYFRDSLEQAAPAQTAAWRKVGLWAVARLEGHLGKEWPERAWEKNGRLPSGMAYVAGHPDAYVAVVELALWLAILCDCEGFADVRRPLKRDAREDVVLHARLELEVGALAFAAGHIVQFERPVPHSSRTSDVCIGLENEQSLLVEARVLLQDQGSVAINSFTDRAFPAIQDICSVYSVDCSGDLSRVLEDADLADLLDVIERHARLVRAGGLAPRLLLHGASLQVSRRESTKDRALRGPSLSGDLWPRIAGRLDEKGQQTEGAENVWLRICALQGLWLFTRWGQLGLQDKLATMRENLRSGLAAHPHVDGVVISSASAWPQGTIEPGEYSDAVGGYALRCAIPPIRARETLVIPLNTKPHTLDHAQVWRDLYASEPDWLDYGLAQLGLPSTAEIFTTPEG